MVRLSQLLCNINGNSYMTSTQLNNQRINFTGTVGSGGRWVRQWTTLWRLSGILESEN